MTDPIADMLTRLRNAVIAKHPRVDVPASKLKVEIARILEDEGYIQGFKLVDEKSPEAAKAVATDATFLAAMARVETPIQFLDAPQFQAFWDTDAKKLANVLQKIGKVE